MPAVRGPEWLYVTTSFPDTHGNYEITCKFCSTVFRGKASRIREHLLKCVGVPSDVRQSIKDIDTKKSAINSTRKIERLEVKRSNTRQQTTLKEIAGKSKKDRVDDAVSAFFYEEGIPFSKIETRAFMKMINALKSSGPAYVPPNRRRLAGSLLDDSYSVMQTTLAKFQDKSVTLCIDGWSTFDDKKIINFMIGDTENAAFFKAEDCSGMVASIEYIVRVTKQAVAELKELKINCVAFCTDNCSNMKAARKRIEEELGVLNVPCVCHSIDLLVEDLGELPWMKPIIERANQVNTYVRGHEKLHSWLKDESPHHMGLKRQSKTRFLTVRILLGRLVEQRERLEKLFVSERARSCRERLGTNALKAKYDDIKKTVMDGSSWDDIEYVIHIFNLPGEMLRMADGHSNPVLGYLYNRFLLIQEAWTKDDRITAPHKKDILAVLGDRWDFAHAPVHSVACLLNPTFVNYPVFGDSG